MVWVTACVMVVLSVGGCGATGVALEPSEPAATETAFVIVDRLSLGLVDLVKESEIVAHVRPVSSRYGVFQGSTQVVPSREAWEDPADGKPDVGYTYTPPPTPMTFVTVEVVEVWKGDLAVGQTIEVRQYGGVLDGVVRLEYGAPQLADYVGKDIVLAIKHLDVWAPEDFSLSSPTEGMWVMNDGGKGGKLRLAVDDLDPNGHGNGADLTVSQLKKAIADL
ncbi:MAG: hypothetical protein LBI33_07890 [Propionibacteriaceae bacterium]|jgi:hypothetical protein|nr:hypothetical protein [Propionibacteriaceae bacterium]